MKGKIQQSTRRAAIQAQVRRVRRICMTMPETLEKVSHGEPTFFAGGKRVFAMFAGDHHDDGHLAVWVPAPPGLQEALVHEAPETYYRPPYVGVSGWVGIELDRIGEDELASHILQAWKMVAPKKLQVSERVVRKRT